MCMHTAAKVHVRRQAGQAVGLLGKQHPPHDSDTSCIL
jgi:hypothetical protein